MHAYKFDVRRATAKLIAKLMRDETPYFDDDVVICPLPTAPSRIRERGFDHAKLLANTFADSRSLPGSGSVVYALNRRSNTRQLGASRAVRMEQMQDEFYVADKGFSKGKTFLLIDDVVTTGASLAAAAKTLKKAGAKRVYATVFAQKI